jgi:hypothetical protein
LPATSIETLPDDDANPDITPKAKKAKKTSPQAGLLQANVSIIEIDGDDDQKTDQLNKISATADITAFFDPVTPVPSQTKGHMKCKLCK